MAINITYEAESTAALADHLLTFAKNRREEADRSKPHRAKELRAEARGIEFAAGIVRDTTIVGEAA